VNENRQLSHLLSNTKPEREPFSISPLQERGRLILPRRREKEVVLQYIYPLEEEEREGERGG